jgi:hypothetical protein
MMLSCRPLNLVLATAQNNQHTTQQEMLLMTANAATMGN